MPPKLSDRILSLEKFKYEFSAKINEQITNISGNLTEIKNIFADFVRESKQIYASKEELQSIKKELTKDFQSSKTLYGISSFMIGGIVVPLIVVIIASFFK